MRRKNIEHFMNTSTVQEALQEILQKHEVTPADHGPLMTDLRTWEENGFIDGYIAALKNHRVYNAALFLEDNLLKQYIVGEIICQNSKHESDIRAKARIIMSYLDISKDDLKEWRDVNGRSRSVEEYLDRSPSMEEYLDMMAYFCKVASQPAKEAEPLTPETEKALDEVQEFLCSKHSHNEDKWRPVINKAALRGMIFDCEALDYEGREIDPSTEKPISEHRPWKCVTKDGVRYIDIKVEDESTRVFFNDTETMSELIRLDISTGDPDIIERYIATAQDSNSELHRFASIIESAVLNLIQECPLVDNSRFYMMLANLSHSLSAENECAATAAPDLSSIDL